MIANQPTQQQRILEWLMKRGSSGVYVFEIMTPRPQGLGIAQYNARIKELRDRGFNIVNKTPGHFVLINNPVKKESWQAKRRKELIEELEQKGQGKLV